MTYHKEKPCWRFPLQVPQLATHLLKTPSEVDCKFLSCQLKKKKRVSLPCIPLFCFVSFSVFIALALVAVSCFCLHVCWCSGTCTSVFVLFGSMACFCYSYFSTIMSFGQFLPLFFFVLFPFDCLFSLSLCIPLALSFYCLSFSIFIFLLPLFHSAAVFCLSLSVYYCIIIPRTSLYHYR